MIRESSLFTCSSTVQNLNTIGANIVHAENMLWFLTFFSALLGAFSGVLSGVALSEGIGLNAGMGLKWVSRFCKGSEHNN